MEMNQISERESSASVDKTATAAPVYKRKRGDRKDGIWLKDIPGLQSIMAHLWPNRTDREVCLFDRLDATELMQYLSAKNAAHPDYKTTIFHCYLYGIAKMLNERPKMNRFICGRRFYQHTEISLSFVAKRRFEDHAEESLMYLVPEENETLDSFSHKISGIVHTAKTEEHAVAGVDATLDNLAKLPRPLLMLIVRIVRWMDFWGVVPRSLTAGDPNYSSVLASNLGSIKAPEVYHHLNNYGTLSIMTTLGELHKEEILMPDGTKQLRDIVDFSATIDESIADGFYYSKSLRLLKHLFRHPELFDAPLSVPSGFEY